MCSMQYVNLTEAAGLLADLWPSATHRRYLTSCFNLSTSLMQMPPGSKHSCLRSSSVCCDALKWNGVRRERAGLRFQWWFVWLANEQLLQRLIHVQALSCFEHMTKGNLLKNLFYSVQSAWHRGAFSFFFFFRSSSVHFVFLTVSFFKINPPQLTLGE